MVWIKAGMRWRGREQSVFVGARIIAEANAGNLPKYLEIGHLWFKVSLGVIVQLLAWPGPSPGCMRAGEPAPKLTQVPSGRPPETYFRFTHMILLWFLLIYFVHPLELESALCRGPESK